MPRLPRINIAHGLYYITVKGSVGETIFTDQKDYTMYLELLKKYKEQYNFKLFSFCLLPDSLGLLMELSEGQTISMIMHDISSSYTKYFNSRYARKGHVFRERFKSVVAEKGPYLLALLRQIHLSPVQAGLVSEPCEYAFSSEIYYLAAAGAGQKKEFNCLIDISKEITEALHIIGELAPEKKNYTEAMEAITSEELQAVLKRVSSQGILGSEEFIASVKKEVEKKEKEVNAANKKLLIPAISLSMVAIVGGVIFFIAYSGNVTPNEKVVFVRPAQKPIADSPLKDLDGTEWVVELKPDNSARHTYPHYDKIIFKRGTISLSALLASGFMASNYSMTIQEDGTLAWETMQVNHDGDTLFWRGEEKDGHMSGKFSRTDKDGAKESVSFASPGYFKVKE